LFIIYNYFFLLHVNVCSSSLFDTLAVGGGWEGEKSDLPFEAKSISLEEEFIPRAGRLGSEEEDRKHLQTHLLSALLVYR